MGKSQLHSKFCQHKEMAYTVYSLGIETMLEEYLAVVPK
jgi:hypothetical protein